MRKEKDKAFVLLETESAKASSLNDSLNELKEKYKNDLKILSGTLSSDATLNSIKETLLNEKQTLSRLVEELNVRKSRYQVLTKELETIETKLNQYEENVKSLTDDIHQYEVKLASLNSTLTQLKSQLSYASLEEAQNAISLLNKNKQEEETAYKNFKQKFNISTDIYNKCQTLITSYKESLPQLERSRDESFKAYTNLVEEYKCDSWQELTSKYQKEDIKHFNQAYMDYSKNYASVSSKIDTIEKRINGQSLPELDELEKDYQDIVETYQNQLEAVKEEEHNYLNNNESLKSLDKIVSHAKEMIHKNHQLTTLYNQLSGNVSGSRMDLETYVQRTYLERILIEAMADEIKESASGIDLDIMFIDEGFGSLDDHSRDEAVKVLMDMSEGSKLIGIISHVSELKQEIEDQLVVSKDDHGSHVKWQIS